MWTAVPEPFLLSLKKCTIKLSAPLQVCDMTSLMLSEKAD